jgi:hypothetical protein
MPLFKHSIISYRYWYTKLLLLYPKPYRERFGDEMVQMFADLYRERKTANRSLLGFIIWVFVETFKGIIKENVIFIMQSKNLFRVVLITALILAVPLVAMQFSDEVDWDLRDFSIMAALLLGTGFTYELGVKRIRNTNHRIIAGLALLGALFLIWAELAVGIFGSPIAGS